MMLRRFTRQALKRRLILAPLLVFCLQTPAGADAWKDLQNRYTHDSISPDMEKRVSRHDPWARLRAIYLPFSESMETAALTNLRAARKVSGYLHKALRPYGQIIRDASRQFLIPPEIIGAVIMVESGGNKKAEASTGTAKGLMQTLAGTFREAREGLRSQGILIENDPFNPKSSIMAGAWYLDRMFAQVAMDGKQPHLNRQNIADWRYPVEYYYAGPGNGRKEKDRVMVYAGGKRIVIDKPAYSGKVLKWAEIMRRSAMHGAL